MSLLRRLAADLRQHHWTGVAIELAIVVLGVFIGLQAANWNEARRDRALERQYLERLREDFVQSADTAQGARWCWPCRPASVVMDALRACRLEGAAQRADVASALYVLGRIQPPMMTRGTIDELRSTGRLGILRSVRLRKALSGAVQENDRVKEVLEFIAARRSTAIGYIDARTTFLVTQRAGSGGPRSAEEVLFDFPALCRDPMFINYVSHLRQAALVLAGQDRRLLQQYRDTIAAIDVELRKDPP